MLGYFKKKAKSITKHQLMKPFTNYSALDVNKGYENNLANKSLILYLHIVNKYYNDKSIIKVTRI